MFNIEDLDKYKDCMAILERTENSFRLMDYTYCELQVYEDGYFRFKHYRNDGSKNFVDSCDWGDFKRKIKSLLELWEAEKNES